MMYVVCTWLVSKEIVLPPGLWYSFDKALELALEA